MAQALLDEELGCKLDRTPSMKEIDGYYNTKKLDKYANGANIYFVVGARRIGKTLHFQKKAFELYDKKGLKTMWLRNKQVELSDPGFYNDFLNAPKSFGWCDNSCFTKPSGVFNKKDEIIKFQSISTFSNRRGNMTADVGMLVFDEFMPEDRKYPHHAHTGLLSLTKTILSGREDAKCYCLSNFVSCANPYFVGFGIYPKQDLDVTYFKEKGIAIEVCRGYTGAIATDNRWNKVYKAGRYQDYAEGTEDSLFRLISPVPKGGELDRIFIMSGGKTYGTITKDSLMYWHECKPGPNAWVIAADISECSDTVSLIPNWFIRSLKTWTEANVMRFNSPNTMYVILSILYDRV